MMAGQHTELCLSLSERPGSTGAFVQNALAARFGLDRVYLPRQVKRGNLSAAVTGIRALNISGFAVSSPFKEEVIMHLDHVTMHAAKIRSVNTVVNDAGMLIGHSTDGDGFKQAYGKMLEDARVSAAVVLGAGPAARAVTQALNEMGIIVHVCARRSRNYELAASMFCSSGSVIDIDALPCRSSAATTSVPTVIINATSERDDVLHGCITPAFLSEYVALIDINVGDTAMIRAARGHTGFVDGLRMAVAQSLLQFELWTGVMLGDHAQELENMVELLQKVQ